MDHEVLFSLRRSAVRRKVLKYLITVHPQGSYPAEIARSTGLSQTQVLGALRGIGGYTQESSLIALDLVEMEFVGGRRPENVSIKLLQKG